MTVCICQAWNGAKQQQKKKETKRNNTWEVTTSYEPYHYLLVLFSPILFIDRPYVYFYWTIHFVHHFFFCFVSFILQTNRIYNKSKKKQRTRKYLYSIYLWKSAMENNRERNKWSRFFLQILNLKHAIIRYEFQIRSLNIRTSLNNFFFTINYLN